MQSDLAQSGPRAEQAGFRLGLLLPGAIVLAALLAIASPAPMRAMAVSTVLLIAGFGAALASYLHSGAGEAKWDQSAMLVFAGFAAALIADHDHWLR